VSVVPAVTIALLIALGVGALIFVALGAFLVVMCRGQANGSDGSLGSWLGLWLGYILLGLAALQVLVILWCLVGPS
jgi:hypothetical protein